ncbi:MAG: YgjV family protein [Ruminococcaceae bacterium]|nr:YgjV family protein [Oscillospiraceae bacterium]
MKYNMQLTGQIFGWITTLLTFISFQCKEHKKLVVVNTLATASLCMSYMFLGAWSGMLMNLVAIVRNIAIYKRDCKFFSHSFWPYLFASLMGILGVLSWQGPMSLLVIAALIIGTLFLYSPKVQNLRKVTVLTAIMVIIYNVYFKVWGGVVNELIAMASAVIGIYRYRKTR